MGKFREFIPVAAATIIIALCALIPLGVGLGDDNGLSEVRSATATLAQTGKEQQAVQAQGQQEQQQLTQAIVSAHQQGASVKEIAGAVVPILGIPEQSALQGVQGIIAQAKAAQTPPAATPAPTKP
jgi:hypothetical protein